MELQKLVQSDLPFVIYKEPHSGQVHIWQQKNEVLNTTDNFEENGFYFAPFDRKKHPTILFPVQHSYNQSVLLRDLKTVHVDFDLKWEANLMLEKEAYVKKIKKAIQIIERGELDKIVLSRKQKIAYQNFPSFAALLKLMNKYEQSYVYLWSHPKVGQWMGATPEILLTADTNEVRTMALAGTQPVRPEMEISWQMKEINEQRYVVDYIAEIFEKYSDNFIISPAKTIYQGNLAHIQSVLRAKMPLKKVNNLLKELHPTPAVCGLPAHKAKDYIAEIENYDRTYYTGFLGTKTHQKIDFYVNLRNMAIKPDHLDIFVGGGIVKDSNPEKEWQETVYKSKILSSIFTT